MLLNQRKKNSGGIDILGSLNPKKIVQDRVRVLSWGGCQSLRATDYKDPPKILVLVKEELNEDTDMFIDSE